MTAVRLPRRYGTVWLLGLAALLAAAGLYWAWGWAWGWPLSTPPYTLPAGLTGWRDWALRLVLGWAALWGQGQGDSPTLFLLGYLGVFVALSALSLPGCSALALLAGATYGAWLGTLLVGCASTLGALLSFLVARHGLRRAVQRRWGPQLAKLDTWVARHGWPAVFCLRLVPVLPYPLLNPLLGLSRLSLAGYFWPSLAGLTLGSLPYVWAGMGLYQAWTGAGSAWQALAGAGLLLLLVAAVGRHWLRRLDGRVLA